MIYYEVNLQIQNEIFDDFMGWLKPHIEDMLGFDGFTDAKLYQQTDHDDADSQSVIVVYSVRDEAALQEYFDNHAAIMRNEGIKVFGTNFKANRRILTNING